MGGGKKIMEKFTREDWLNYINNLNNREISKKNASGINLWALFGFFGFTFFKLLDSLPKIFLSTNNLFLTLLYFINIYNFFIVLITFIETIVIPLNRNRKITTKLSIKSSFIVNAMANLIVLIGIICNFYVVIFLKSYGLNSLPYYFFGFNGVINIFGKIALKRITYSRDSKMPKIDFGIYYHKTKITNIVKIFNGFLSLILFFLLAFSIAQIIQNNYLLANLDLLKSSFYIIVLIATTYLFILQIIWSMKFDWLEQFEKKIMLRNFSEKEIVKEFIEEFAGKDVIQWLNEIKNETLKITVRLKKYFKKSIELKNDLDLDAEEKDLNRNLKKIANILIKDNEIGKNIDNDIGAYEIYLKKIKYLLKQGPLSGEEELIIKEFEKDAVKNMKKIKDLSLKRTNKSQEIYKYVEKKTKGSRIGR